MRHLPWIIIGSLLISACASTSNVATRYLASPAEPVGPRMLLAGRSAEPHVRHDWESVCATQLQRAGYQVTRSEDPLPGWFEPDSEELLRWSQAHDVDVILIAELTRLLPGPMMEPPGPDQRRDAGGAGSGRGSQGTLTIPLGESLRERPRDTPDLQQNIEVMLLESNGHALWAADISTDEANEVRAVAKSQCREIRNTLRELGLTPR